MATLPGSMTNSSFVTTDSLPSTMSTLTARSCAAASRPTSRAFVTIIRSGSAAMAIGAAMQAANSVAISNLRPTFILLLCRFCCREGPASIQNLRSRLVHPDDVIPSRHDWQEIIRRGVTPEVDRDAAVFGLLGRDVVERVGVVLV